MQRFFRSCLAVLAFAAAGVVSAQERPAVLEPVTNPGAAAAPAPQVVAQRPVLSSNTVVVLSMAVAAAIAAGDSKSAAGHVTVQP